MLHVHFKKANYYPTRFVIRHVEVVRAYGARVTIHCSAATFMSTLIQYARVIESVCRHTLGVVGSIYIVGFDAKKSFVGTLSNQ
jgi:hypothetical protein